LAAVAAIAASSSLHAGFPALNVQWTLDGNLVFDDLPVGSSNGMGGYRYVGGHSVGAVSMSYDLVGIPDPRISANFTLENFSAQTVEVELLITLPIAPSFPAPSSLTGSVAVGMTADDDGGLLAALPGVAFWQAMMDGMAVGGATDLLAGLSASAGPAESVAAGNAGFLQIPGPEVLTDIGILITFSLTAGEQMSFTSVFDVVPAPGGLGLLCFAAVFSRRRRRAC
jgi:hypothetical protein